MQATILKLLTLCALAHFVIGFNLAQSPPEMRAQTQTQSPSPSPSQSHSPMHKYMLVRGEGGGVQAPKDNAGFESAATTMLQTYNDEQRNDEIEACSAPKHKASFSLFDYAVLLLMLAISLGIGVFYGFFQDTGASSSDFLLGSQMSLFPVTLSLTTSFITAIELLGNPAEMYFQGTQFVLIVIPMVFVIPVAVKIFYPIYFKMELTSCYEYLGIRFGKEIRILGALLYVVQMCFYTSVAVLAPAIALSKATGLDTKIAVVLIYVVCVFYSSQGGMKAVVIADTFQAAVLAVSLLVLIALGSWYSGNPIDNFVTAMKRERIEFFNFDFNPTTRHTVWSVVIGGFFYWTSLFCTNQASVQKCMSLRSMKLAKVALGFAILGLIVVFSLNFYTGLMVFNHYAACDPLSAGRISATDQLLPYYVISTYEHIYAVAGIFVAGIFAASLGTVASALNSLSAVTCEDLLVNGMNIKITPEKGALYAKWMSLGYGILSFGLVFIVEHLGGVLQVTLTLNGLIGGVTLGLFVLGIAAKSANTKGTFYGGLLSLVIVIFIGIIAQFADNNPAPLPLSLEHCNCHVNATLDATVAATANNGGASFIQWPIFKLSYMWYSMIGCLLTIFLGYTFSLAVNAIQRYKMLKLTAAAASRKNAEANAVCVCGRSLASAAPPLAESTEKYGHINLAIRIDDE